VVTTVMGPVAAGRRESPPFSAAEYITAPIHHWIAAPMRPSEDPRPGAPANSPRDGDGAASAAAVHRLDRAGIAGAVLYPDNLFWAYRRLHGRSLTDLLRRYNDWILETCAEHPQRLRPAVLLDVDEPETAASEVRRTAPAGAAAAVIPLFSHNEQRYDSRRYAPLWDALEQCRIPLTLHRGTCRHIDEQAQPFDLALHRISPDDALFDLVFDALEGSYARLAVTAMTLSGVFARHPGLNVVVIGFGLAWVPHAVLRLDEQYEVRPERAGGAETPAAPLSGPLSGPLSSHALVAERSGFQFTPGERPSDHFRRHVFVAADDDPPGLQLRDFLGPRHLLWAGGRRFPGLSKEERAAVERRNAISLYGAARDPGPVR
jgi:predicted TIM-barrel fold metal-dependent hydrolase